jgi:Zn-dependent protease
MTFDVDKIVTALATSVIPMILSLALHEWGHAAAAVALGDETPREQGRFTLNPVAHMDWLGTVLLPLLLALSNIPVFGWARPVQFTPRRFTRRVSMSTGVMLTAAAGPAMNLLIAIAAAGFVAAAGHLGLQLEQKYNLLATKIVFMNVTLFLLNLLPFPPLDGSRVLLGLLPNSLRDSYGSLERYSAVFLAALLLVGGRLITLPSTSISDGLMKVAASVFP